MPEKSGTSHFRSPNLINLTKIYLLFISLSTRFPVDNLRNLMENKKPRWKITCKKFYLGEIPSAQFKLAVKMLDSVQSTKLSV